jgi:hypothetical protein
MARRCNLAEVERDGVASLCEFDLCGIWCLCEIGPSRGRPWWLYICSQLGFTGSFCLLLQVEVLGLAGFMYPSSGLLPWQEPGRQMSRTEGSYPRHRSMPTTAASAGIVPFLFASLWSFDSDQRVWFQDLRVKT